MKKTFFTLLATAAAITTLAFASADAMAAQDSGISVGLSTALQTHYGLACPSSGPCDRNASGGAKITLGKQLTPNFGVEAMAFQLGRATGLVNSGSTAVAGSGKANGVALSAVASTELGPFTLKGKLGAAYVHGSTSYSAGGGATSNNLVLPALGAGVSYAINKEWAMNADWDYLPVKLNGNTKTHASLFTLGVSYKF
jgi:opacity protein-like surface antigen